MDNTKETVSEIQKWLRLLSTQNIGIPNVYIDGIYGEETRNAIRAFQKYKGLPETGDTDNVTFDLLYKEYNKVLEEIAGYNISNDINYSFENPAYYGEKSDRIYHLQLILRALAEFTPLFKINLSGTLDDKTQNAIKKFNIISGFDENTPCDNIFIKRLTKFANKSIY